MNHPPIYGHETWRPVIEQAAGRCWCTGACGTKHAITGGQCDHTDGQHLSKHGPSRLIVAPPDLARARFPGAARTGTQLVAWCIPCYDKARARAEKKAKAQQPEPDGLFDLA